MSEQDINAVHVAVKELRETYEAQEEKSNERFESMEQKFESFDALDKNKVDKCLEVIEAQEAKNQEITIEQQKIANEQKEQKEQIENLEANLVAGVAKGDIDQKDRPEYKSFNELIQKYGQAVDFHPGMLSEEAKSFLRTDIGSQGGYKVPEVLDNEFLRTVTETSPVLGLVRSRNLRGVKNLNIAVRNGIPTSYWVGEAEQVTASKSSYELKALTAHALGIKTTTTRDLLEFAQSDMLGELQVDASEEFARAIGNALLLGDANHKPLGILDSNSGVSQIETAASTTMDLDDVINLIGELKVGYNPTFAFHRKILIKLRTEKDSNGNYLWRLGGETMPNTLADVPYVLMQDMTTSSTVAGDLPVLLGDFFRGYTVLDAMDMEVIRDDVTEADKRKVTFNWFRFMDGQVTVPEAFKILKVKA